MFGLRDLFFGNSAAAQLEEMNHLGEAFTDLARAGDGERAIHKFIQLANCQPTWTQFHFDVMDHVVRRELLANVLHGPLQSAVREDPSNSILHYINGLYHQSLGSLDKAVADYQAAIQINPKFAVAYHNLGITYRIQGRLDLAIGAWQKAVELDSRLAEPHLALGIQLRNMGRKKEADKHIRKFLDLANPSLEGYKNSASMLL